MRLNGDEKMSHQMRKNTPDYLMLTLFPIYIYFEYIQYIQKNPGK